jgi:hypothetical protein
MATTDVFRTMIVPSANAALARQIAETVAPVAGLGMWQSQLSADGSEPATHYVSTGYIGPEWEVLMPLQTWEEIDGVWTQTDADPGDAAQLLGAIQAMDPDSTITIQQIVDLFAAADVTTQDPWVAFGRLGLQTVQVAEPEPV